MNQYLKLDGKLIWLFGKSGTGKTNYFTSQLLPNWHEGPVYVKSKDPEEWKDKPVELLENNFDIANIDDLPSNCLIFFDDFVKKGQDKDFQEIVNFNLRHESKTLILCIHDIFKSGLYSDLLQSSHFFITYCPSSLKLLQILDKQYKFNFREKFQAVYSLGVTNHHIAYLNTDTQTFFPNLNLRPDYTSPIEMFHFDESKVIFHSSDQPCPSSGIVENDAEGTLETSAIPLHLFKWEKRGRYVLKALQGLLDDKNCLLGKPIRILFTKFKKIIFFYF